MEEKDKKTGIALGWPLHSKRKKGVFLKSISGSKAVSRHNFGNAVSFNESSHLISIARTGSGKGVSAIIPTLLSYAGPAIVIDPKGENFFVTAKYRRETLGHKVFAVDPFGVIDRYPEHSIVERPCGINVFGPLLSPDSNQKKGDSTTLARMMTGIDPSTQKDPYWQNSAESLLTGLIQLVASLTHLGSNQKSLKQVVDLLMRPDIEDVLNYLLNNQSHTQIDEFARRSLQTFLNNADMQRQIIKSMSQTNIELFDSPEILHCLSSDDIKADVIKAGDRFTVYIIMPPNKLASHSRVFSMIVVAMLNIITQRSEIPKLRTLFMLDECAQFGTLDELRRAVTLLRGFGLQVWMFFQDLSQLTHLYADSASLINNCGVVQVFGMGRRIDAEPIELMLGVPADDLLSLDNTQQVVSFAGNKPQTLRRLNYLRDYTLLRRAAANPYYKD
ncbi:type IV secretory system conjugative DNA transfer family protein [uncultured Roseobacter sp.]|uniref:type IV secretory system conjugative DNA transfer family protein n=1 Tax=uncultured Roseobacter sp. TaxID=114847 RepID=UPI00260ABC4C|nr:type IV secretory system conjugative DNA transfer family protein [uncultured Roseobacter sp.]